MMTSGFHPRLRLLAIVGGLALAACVLGLMATHKPASAAFPGTNGKIAFDRKPATGTDNDTEIYTITADGKTLKRLTNNSFEDAEPAFSPDGSRIALISNRYGSGRFDIFIMNPGVGVKRVTHTTAFNELEPAFSPDGMKIAFVRLNDIFVRNTDGTNEIQLTNIGENTGENRYPAWSPDGSKILFTRDCDISSPCFGIDLWVMNADGTDVRRFFTDSPTPQGCASQDPDWSPDGTKVVFVFGCSALETQGIYVANADGSGQKRLTTAIVPSGDAAPVWSPNGRKIAFIRATEEPEPHVTGQHDIYVMRADGTNITNITNTPEADEHAPSWQPRQASAG